MSKLSKAAEKLKEVSSLRPEEIVTNYMGGDSYIINPLDTLKMVSASSIFAEPSYYRSSKSSKALSFSILAICSAAALFSSISLISLSHPHF